MKSIAIPLIVFLLAFIGSLTAVLAATGNLNREAFEKILGKQSPATTPQETPDEMDTFVLALKERQQQLENEKKQLDEERKRLRITRDDLSDLSARLEKMLQEINTWKETSTKAKQDQAQKAAQTIANMDPKKAAAALKDWPPNQAAEILQYVKEKDRAKILDQMDSAATAQILEYLKNVTQ